MAASLSGVKRWCGALALCAMSAAVAAELTDPTRPPATAGASGGGAALPEGDNLQSIIISPTRRAAVINGSTVEIGERYGGAKLVEVSESGVVLQDAEGRRMLQLFPGVSIRRVEAAPAAQMKRPAGTQDRRNAKDKKRGEE